MAQQPHRGHWAVDTRQLSPTEVRLLFGFLELLGHDPNAVGELKVTTAALGGLTAEVTHRRDPRASRLVVPGQPSRPAPPQLVIAGP